MSNNIGYIINESGATLEDFSVINDIPSPSSGTSSKLNFKYHNKDRVIGYGVLQTANEKNRNGRIYKKEDLMREIKAPRQVELLEAGQLCGEAGHPIGKDAESLPRQQTIDPKNVCVRFHKLWMEGNNVMGYFEGTNNAAGETFDKDLRSGITPAFSLRALGTIKSTPSGAVVENLKMITYDYVIFPSHKGAYTKGVITESTGVLNRNSNFVLTKSNDASKSYIKEFTNHDAIQAVKRTSLKESAINYIKDNSSNFKMLKEYFDLNRFDTIDIINAHQMSLTEAGNSTIIMNIDDYISKELQNYTYWR